MGIRIDNNKQGIYPEQLEIGREHAAEGAEPLSREESMKAIFSKMRDTERDLEITKQNLGKLGAEEVGFYLKRVNDAQKAYKEAIGNAKTAEMVQGLIQAGTQIAASLYGLKHNLAIGKLDFQKTDFGRQYEEAMNTLRQAKETGKIEARAEVVGKEEELKVKEESLSERLKKLGQQKKALTGFEEEEKRVAAQKEMMEERAEAAEEKAAKAEAAKTKAEQIDTAKAKRSKAVRDLDKLAAKDRKFEDTEHLVDTYLGIDFDSWNNAEASKLAELTGLPQEQVKNYIDATNIGSDKKEYKDKMEKLLSVILKERIKEQEGILTKLGASFEEGAAPPQTIEKPVEIPKGGAEVRRQLPDGRIAIFNADTKEFIRYAE
jgi:hypothetical protein